MIDLHYSACPNEQKFAIMFEEICGPYRVIPYDIFNRDDYSIADMA